MFPNHKSKRDRLRVRGDLKGNTRIKSSVGGGVRLSWLHHELCNRRRACRLQEFKYLLPNSYTRTWRTRISGKPSKSSRRRRSTSAAPTRELFCFIFGGVGAGDVLAWWCPQLVELQFCVCTFWRSLAGVRMENLRILNFLEACSGRPWSCLVHVRTTSHLRTQSHRPTANSHVPARRPQHDLQNTTVARSSIVMTVATIVCSLHTLSSCCYQPVS